MPATIIRRAAYDPAANLAFEERLFEALRRTPSPICLFYVNDPCVLLGRSNRVEEWVTPAAAEDGVPVLRRFSGGGAVYHDRDVLNYSLILPKRLVEGPGGITQNRAPGTLRYIDLFRGVVIRALERGGIGGLSASGLSDISLHGRKISGNAERIASGMVLHHGTLLRRCPLAAIERYLMVPPNRPGVPHRGFVTGLAEEGVAADEAALMEWIAAEFSDLVQSLEHAGPQDA